MAKRLLGKAELEDIVRGAALLSTISGVSRGLEMIKKIKNKVTLVDPADCPDSANAVAVAGVGGGRSPKAPARIFQPKASMLAYEAMKNITAVGGVNLDYLIPGEVGQTTLAMYLASENNVPVVDADNNGRNVPELATSLAPIYKIPTRPLVVANDAGDILIAYLADPYDAAAAETVARNAAISAGGSAAFCTWIVNIATIKKCLVPYAVSKEEKIGKTIREARASGKDAVKEVIALTGGKELFRGKIQKTERVGKEGFNFGRTVIEGIAHYKGKTFTIDIKNENMIAWQDGKPVIMVPDLITMMTTDGEPLGNADAREGMEMVVVGIPAWEPWRRIPEGFGCWKHILGKMGYTGGYIPLEVE